MFFRPTPSKFEQAKQAAIDAAASARETASHVADSAHSLLEQAPQVAASVADVVTHKASEVGGVVAAKVDAVRHRGDDVADAAQDSVEAAQLKAAATRKAAEIAAKEAEKAARDTQKKAEAEIARIEKDLAHRRADFEKQKEFIEARSAKLDEARVAAEQQAQEIHARRKDPLPVEALTTTKTTTEVRGDDDEFEYQVVAEKEGGSKLWVLLGGAIMVGAALVYFFAPGSGRRSRAAIKDRLGKVKDDAVDKVTGAADAASQKGKELTERADDLSQRAGDKLAEVSDKASDVAQDVSASTTATSRHAIETYEDTMPMADESDVADAVRVASENTVDGVAVGEPLDSIKTAATAGSELDEPRHPNIFDKVAELAGGAASAAEHFAGEPKQEEVAEPKEDAEDEAETDSADEASASNTSTSTPKKKNGK